MPQTYLTQNILSYNFENFLSFVKEKSYCFYPFRKYLDLRQEKLSTKDQIILKGTFGILKFSQKTNEQIRYYYYDKFVCFLGEFEDTKKFFRN